MKYLRRWPVSGELYGVSVPARIWIVCWGYQAFSDRIGYYKLRPY